AHGIEPLLVFDALLVTFLFPDFDGKLSDSDLIYMQAYQLEHHDGDLAHLQEYVIKAHFRSIADFEQHFWTIIYDYNFKPGILVLVLNKKIEPGGTYYLADLNSAISCLKFAAFCLISYHARSRKESKMTEFINQADLMGIAENHDDNDI
ncbi:uncharacterized protein BT62DRAFT_912225, partial [Guyanagaster necrorhizus]